MQNQYILRGSNKEEATVVNQDSQYIAQKEYKANNNLTDIKNMNPSVALLIFGAIIIVVLNVILFFKIWNATDNIKKMLNIAEKYEKNQQKELL